MENVALDVCKGASRVECYILPNVIHYAEKSMKKVLKIQTFLVDFYFNFAIQRERRERSLRK